MGPAAANDGINSVLAELKRTVPLDMRSVGATGLRHFSGVIKENALPQLDGQQGIAIYKEMSENDPLIFGILSLIDRAVRRMDWRTEPASRKPEDMRAADHVEQCREDMSRPWKEFISEAMTMAPYGHCLTEICYKKRAGESCEPRFNSRFADGRVGWRDLPIRSQDTLWRWHFSESGDIVAVDQWAPPTYAMVTIPMSKALLFRPRAHKNSPEGISVLRGAYTAWYRKRGFEALEGVGAERDLAGLPVMRVPGEMMMGSADPAMKQQLEYYKNIVKNVRRDEQEGLVLPSDVDMKGNKLFEFQLVSSGGARQYDVDKIIQRYDQRIAASLHADFVLLGQVGGTGSWAMHTDKTQLFAEAVESFVDTIVDVLNTQAVPRLLAFCDFDITEHPRIAHGALTRTDKKELGDYILKLTQAGMPLFPNPQLEKYLLNIGNMPDPLEQEVDLDQQVEEPHGVTQDSPPELHDPPVAQNDVSQQAKDALALARGETTTPFAQAAAQANGRQVM